MKKVIGKLHLWLGLASGLFVFILGITGCVLVFEKELTDHFYHDAVFVKESGQKEIPLQVLYNSVENFVGDDKPVSRIEVTPDSDRAYIFKFYKNKESIFYWDSNIYSDLVYVNQYTGKIQKEVHGKWSIFSVALALHYDLMLGEIGHFIIPWATVIFVIMLITGLVLWWPKNKSARKQRVRFKWKPTTKWRRKNYDLHNVLGFYSLLFCLVLGITGLVFGFQSFNKGLSKSVNLISGSRQSEEKKQEIVSDTLAVGKANLSEILNDCQKRQPKVEKFQFIIPEDSKGIISVRCYPNPKNFFRQNTLSYDQFTGKFLADELYKKLSPGEKLVRSNYDIHVGKIIGIPGQILAFAASLIAASLPVTGFIIWYGRKKKLNKK